MSKFVAGSCLHCPDSVVVRTFADDAVAFDERSGNTHHLSADAAGLLLLLQERGPLTREGVLHARPVLSADERGAQQMFEDLRCAGLIEMIEPVGE